MDSPACYSFQTHFEFWHEGQIGHPRIGSVCFPPCGRWWTAKLEITESKCPVRGNDWFVTAKWHKNAEGCCLNKAMSRMFLPIR